MEVKEAHCLYTDIKKYLLKTSVGARVAPGIANIRVIEWVSLFGRQCLLAIKVQRWVVVWQMA